MIPLIPMLVLSATTTLSLDDALAIAAKNQPRVRETHAAVMAALARIDQARSNYFPQIIGSAQYQRQRVPTSFGGSSGAGAGGFNRSADNLSFGLSADQLIYDFGRTSGSVESAASSARANIEDSKQADLEIALDVRTMYFTAVAQKELIVVAKETLSNQEKHMQQISGFIEVGTRPAIDLVQAKTDVANARVQLVKAESDYLSTKAALNNAIGREGPLDYEVIPVQLAPIENEDAALEIQLSEAMGTRPELAAIAQRTRAQEATLSSIHGQYWPSISASGQIFEGGAFDNLDWNASVGVGLSWPIFEGGITRARVREAEAEIEGLDAQADEVRQGVRLELEQVRATLSGAKEALSAAIEAAENARVRLNLAEGRYETGVGNILELSDAQLALTSADAQRVQADFTLASARARLIKALGRI